ncbi:hypothetical protein VPK21_001345 (plasmid) [Sinorhizobium kummerowiae]|uniref:Uncharacterized protein n=1 Tax=Sinorhizobium kummerowiae TaxID=158892 RepID=A0ABY8TFT1_9HYPH|nr:MULTISPECIES: hypothetical protein [Sinorhizobium]WHS96637.1 hypothetical protein PZL22_005575 [Sinorhizobium kummerowiae]WQH41426.1 hypothetical protein VPK21_001345 [Sinorhizobium kummerowiae]
MSVKSSISLTDQQDAAARLARPRMVGGSGTAQLGRPALVEEEFAEAGSDGDDQG